MLYPAELRELFSFGAGHYSDLSQDFNLKFTIFTNIVRIAGNNVARYTGRTALKITLEIYRKTEFSLTREIEQSIFLILNSCTPHTDKGFIVITR